MTSAPSWRRGRGGERARRHWRSGRGSCWPPADGLKNTEIAERLGVDRPMVTKWRNRFAEQRLDGLTR